MEEVDRLFSESKKLCQEYERDGNITKIKRARELDTKAYLLQKLIIQNARHKINIQNACKSDDDNTVGINRLRGESEGLGQNHPTTDCHSGNLGLESISLSVIDHE